MEPKILSEANNKIKVEITVEFSESMIKSELAIQKALNAAGTLITEKLLEHFDTDGTAINICGAKLTSKGQVPQKYQTPYGQAVVARHVYQSSKGGKTLCPLEQNARIILKATPRFAEQISHKAAEMASPQVCKDLALNYQRSIARSYVKKLSEAVASVVQIKEEKWSYNTPQNLEDVKAVSVGLDGTCMLICQDGYRQAMVGTLSLYNTEGDRLHTIYVAAEPEYGKSRFINRMEKEIEHIKVAYPEAEYIGLADGVADNWEFLKHHVDTQVLDFYHVTEYLADIAPISSSKTPAQKLWLEQVCHRLKHKHGAASRILHEIERWRNKKISKALREKLEATITYFNNHKKQMTYAKQISKNNPIGSGVTEAACKVIVKQRMCKSGMKWKEKGAGLVLSLRTLSYSGGRWEQFWSKVDQCGF